MWYFAYGSDLHRHAVADWCKQAQRPLPRRDAVRPATLTNHRLCFPHYDPFWNGGTADIQRSPGKSVGGALIQVSAHGLETLDRMAGRVQSRHGRDTSVRRHIHVKVTPFEGGPPIDAITFQLLHRDDRHIPPTRLYMDRLIEAAVGLGLSTMWVMHLNSFEVLEPAVRYVPPLPPIVAPPRFVRRFVEHVPALAHRPRRELELAGAN